MVRRFFWVGLVLVVSLLVISPSFRALEAQERPKLITLDEAREWIKQDPGEPQFKVGDVLTYKDIDKLKPFVPKEFWTALFQPDMRITIGETRDYSPHASYMEATKKFGAQTKVGPKGELLNFVAGFPFAPESIKVGDPAAGYKIAWNWEYRWQSEGLGLDGFQAWLRAPGGVINRKIGGIYKKIYLNHRADLPDQGYKVKHKEADVVEYKQWVQITDPYDVKDTTFVTQRYLDPFKEDDGWAYVPALRRVRRLSLAMKCDSFMGTEFTMDDFYLFDGRVVDWDWGLLARKKMISIIGLDFRTITGDKELYGDLKCVPYARVELRDHFILDNVPHWARYPYGRKLLYFDTQNMFGDLGSAWDKKDDLWKVFYLGWFWSEDKEIDTNNVGTRVPVWNVLSSIDLQNYRGTVWMPGKGFCTYTGMKLISPNLLTGEDITKFYDINRLIRGR